MAIDLFNNPSNDYIYPGLSPCPGIGDDQYLVWTENGLAIIKGSDVVSEIGFNDLQVPVNSFSKQQVTLGPGEVTFIPGLTKGLCNKNMGFFLPALNSSDLGLNSFFLGIDFSINYYKNFSYTSTHIDVSGNFEQNIGIADALNIKLNELGIKVASTYDPSILCFTGTILGYEYFITNAILRVYDVSEAWDSPFPVGGNSPTYDLIEDPSAFIPAMKYPNTAMQGIALKGIYPNEQAECDKWLYLHHVTDYVITFDPYDVNYDTEDTSIFYLRHRRKIEIGMNGCSVEDLMSAGDYLNLVTNRGWWKKVGDIYIWISSPDCEGDCLNKNLIEGFYAFNPHEFTIQIEYMVIV